MYHHLILLQIQHQTQLHPTPRPTDEPSPNPTSNPTAAPTNPTLSPTNPPVGSTAAPTGATLSPTTAPTDAPVYVDLCDNQPCDCVNEDIHCQYCQQPANICAQCDSGYFRLNDNTPCTLCQDVFGTQCLFCQNTGCGQCSQGYTRTYDSQENLYYCKENTLNPTPSPTEKPTNNPTVTAGSGGSGPCEDVTNTISHCSEDENCINCQSWGGCTQCANGYWIFQFNYRCQQCSNIDNCNSCNPWVGCSSCNTGYHLVWNTQCPTSTGGSSTVATCEAD